MDLHFPLFPTAAPSVAIPHQSPLVSPAPHLLSRCKSLLTWLPPSPATCQPPPLVPVPRAVCLRLLQLPLRSALPLCRSWPATRSLSASRGVLPARVPPRLFVPASLSPRSPPNPGIVRSLVSCWVGFRARERGQVASTPWQSHALVLAPPVTWLFRSCSGYPPLLPPLSTPLVAVIVSLSVVEVWSVLLEVGVKGAVRCHGRGCSSCKTEGPDISK